MLLFKNDPFFNLVDDLIESSKSKLVSSGYVQFFKSEDESDYKLEFVVPSLTKEDISISLEEDLLKIKYEKSEDSTLNFINSFERVFSLPEDINDKKIDAKILNGILTITIPKQKKKTTQRTISVN